QCAVRRAGGARRAAGIRRSRCAGSPDAPARPRAARLGHAPCVGRMAPSVGHARAAVRTARPRAARLTMDARLEQAVAARRNARVLLSSEGVAAVYDRMARSIAEVLA